MLACMLFLNFVKKILLLNCLNYLLISIKYVMHVWKESTRKAHSNQKICVSTSRPLQLLHIDLFGPTRTTSLGGKSYGFVIVDDFSWYTWVLFLSSKNEALDLFTSFWKIFQNEKVILFQALKVIMEKNLKILVLMLLWRKWN